MNKKTIINILEEQKYHLRYEDGDIMAVPRGKSIAIKFIFNEKVGRERLLKEIIIGSSMKKSELNELSKDLKTTFHVPLYNWDMKVLP